METKDSGKSEKRRWGHSHSSSQKVVTGAPSQISAHKTYCMGGKEKTKDMSSEKNMHALFQNRNENFRIVE